jgi:RHS repeat-associated protein
VTFSAAQRANCCGAGGQDFRVFIADELGSVPVGTFKPTTTDYQEYSTIVFSPQRGPTASLQFVGLNSAGGDNTVLIDDVRITIIDNVEWMLADQLGTPRMMFDKTGALANVKRHDYLPFGEELMVNQGLRTTARGYGALDGVRQKFTLKERDNETGLDYFLARYYSSTQGRFISPDEFTGGPDEYYEFHDLASENPTFYADLTDPQSLNKYQYCYNNPLLYIDLDGHQGVREWFRNTLNGAASTVSENNGFGRMDAPQTTTGRVIGHVISIAQGGAEIYGGASAVVGGGGEAIITAPAAGTVVGALLPAAGVVTAGAGAIVTVHGGAVVLNTVKNIFSKNSSQQSSGANEQKKVEPPKKDRSVEGTQVQHDNIKHAQKVHQNAGRPERIRSIKKSEQNVDNALKKIKSLKDAENQ